MKVYLSSIIAGFIITLLTSLMILHNSKTNLVVHIKPELADVQSRKEGTPSSGGIAFCVGSTVASLFFGVNSVLLLGMWMFALIGFWDDMEKTHTLNGDGLTPMIKMLLQLLCSATTVMALYLTHSLNTQLFGHDWNRFYYFFAVFYIVFFVNAVNITDGLDGLAALVTLVPLILLAIINGNTFLYAFIGSLLAFLLFNLKPAKYFMGDCGSHAIGAVLAISALLDKSELITLLSSSVLVIELLSSLVQIISIRTFGKRVFSIAPLHHAFEKKGIGESSIVAGFALASVALSLVAFALWLRG
ncbi:MAG: phospho-N-acetylmuramoyl-pentapeptide-transferase [Sphaerochaetaceae bacterium]